MCKRIVELFLLVLSGATAAMGQSGQHNSLVERVAETGFVRVEAESFNSLDAKQQELAYWLTQASIAVDPIVYDQFSRFGLRQKRLLEGIVAHPKGIDAGVRTRITDFAKLFWANKGNHNELTSQKFLPGFAFEELKQAALIAQKSGAFSSKSGDLPPITTSAELNAELENLRDSLFDANFEPMLTAKNPTGGLDAIRASSNTFYVGVTLADLKDFHDTHPLNSRVARGKNGKLEEEVYRAGTPDGKVAPGLYATYRDARGAKASSQTFVSITDKPVTEMMIRLGQNADYFEEKAPWDAKYRKQTFQPPVVKAVETLVEAGDFSVSVIGDNLPNENEIHEKYGTKNFLFTSSTRALNNATGDVMAKEFSASPEIAERSVKYGNEAGDLMTALHEVIGHGSGKLSERLKGGAEPYLKGYFSTLEEGRADLSALWNAWDPKLKELGLVSNQEEVAKAMYDSAAMAALTQLRRIPKGDSIEEDHQRDRQLIVNYIRARVPGAIEQFDRDEKTYIRVQDYAKMRQGVGMLLTELMRIKAEGDYDAIKGLVDEYAVHFEPKLRDQVVARHKELNVPTYWAGINSKLTARAAAEGHVQDVKISYPSDAVEQYLAYGSLYDKSLLPADKPEKK